MLENVYEGRRRCLDAGLWRGGGCGGGEGVDLG